MANREGRPKLHGIEEYFRPASGEGFMLNRVTRKLCLKSMAKHASKQLRHLRMQCTGYRQLHGTVPNRQPLINTKMDSLSKTSKEALDRQAAIAVFTSGKPYSQYEEPETLKLFHMLNSVYKPSYSNRIASFLGSVFLEYRERVESLLNGAPYLNIILDASDDISSNRIVNVSIEIPNSVAFYWTTIDTKDHDHRALATLSLIEPTVYSTHTHTHTHRIYYAR